MSIDLIFASAASSLGWPETIGMLFGGAVFGAFVLWISPAFRAPHLSVRYLWFLLWALGLVFFVSRGAALYFDGNMLWPRNIGFGILWTVYVLVMALAIELRRRASHRDL